MIIDFEHIYATNRASHEGMKETRLLEKIGNKSLLEKRINIRAFDYKFVDKKKYYEGFNTALGVSKEGTKIVELQKMADERIDFTEQDIQKRHEDIVDGFIDYLRKNDLIR